MGSSNPIRYIKMKGVSVCTSGGVVGVELGLGWVGGQQTMKTYLYTTSFIDVILQKYLSFFQTIYAGILYTLALYSVKLLHCRLV